MSELDYIDDHSWLMKGDCLERMKEIPDGSIDLILTDPPYGTTACKWDTIVPFDKMWEQSNRIIKPNGAIVLFANQPFTSALVMSNPSIFKYQWVWNKIKASGHLNAKIQPMSQHEDILVFGKYKLNYYPQGIIMGVFKNNRPAKSNHKLDTVYGKATEHGVSKIGNYPKTIVEFSKPNDRQRLHPTQKPVPLLEYLIKTYTLEDESVLDFTMGSGSTGVAAKNLNRKFIGIEMDDKYYDIAVNRINGEILTAPESDDKLE